MLDKGINLLSGNLLDIKKSYGTNNVLIKSAQDFSKYIPDDAHIISKTVDSVELLMDFDPNELLKTLVNNNINIEKFEIKVPSLQEIFIKKVGESR